MIGVAAFMEFGTALMEIQSRKLWKASGHPTWRSYLREVAGMSPPHAHRIVEGSQIALELVGSLPNGNDPPPMPPVSESQVRPLAKIKDPEARKSIWIHSVKDAGGQPTAKTVAAKVAEYMAENDEPPAAPEGSNTADDGEANEETPVIEVEVELVAPKDNEAPKDDEAAKDDEAPKDATLPPQGGEKVDEEQGPVPSKAFIDKWCFMIALIRREARTGCRKDEIIRLANELDEDMKSAR